ncbi:MAG: helix-turn-helix domain-containing protein [Gemmatimonadaceae bacterium]
MDKRKQKRLEAVGWQVGSAAEFLGLSAAEAQLVEMKLVLSAKLRATSRQRHWTQTALAKRLGSRQSRVAKMEAGDPSVSLALLVRGLLAVGATPRDIARTLSTRAAWRSG